jgi:AraC-like DNA-binding protein
MDLTVGVIRSIPDRIDELIGKHGSLRAVARALKMDPAYLLRLHYGEKDNPSAATLRKLRLRRIVQYVSTECPNE